MKRRYISTYELCLELPPLEIISKPAVRIRDIIAPFDKLPRSAVLHGHSIPAESPVLELAIEEGPAVVAYLHKDGRDFG